MAAAQTQALYQSRLLVHHMTETSLGSQIHSYVNDGGPDKPILTLIHGYPQSAYINHAPFLTHQDLRGYMILTEDKQVASPLCHKVSLFVPELPGYGISTPIEDRSRNDKRSVGTALLEALSKVFNTTATSSSSPRRIILGGHDRGARIAHRLAVDFSHPPSDSSSSLFQTLNLTVIGTVLMDIIPTLSQWQAFSDPKTVTGYFHWPLLANADLATAMITAYWGGHWCREALKRIAGSNPQSWDRIASNNALDIYGVLFAKRDTIYYSSLDYEAGATTDVTQQEEDQRAGRKIEVPLLVLYSKAKLGATVDVEAVWRDWIQPPPEGSGSESNHFYEAYGVGDGYGHYLPEEAYDIVGQKIAEFLKKVA
ncbi:hypothetical protein HRR75_002485 [Exophiala dermatitidis]|nr:hypothetical protein HRR75_002485 [Exophiala dermatitidis]